MKRKHKKDSVVSLETNCTTDDSEMIKRLKEDDEFIGELINSIPAKFYFDVELQSEIKENKHQTVREKIKGIKRKVSIKKQHEIAKLDPCQQKTVTEIQGELKSEMKSPMKRSKFQSASMTRAANLEELQERLKKKIEALAANRKGKSSSLSSEGKQLKRKMEKSKRKRPSKKIKIITDQNAKIKVTTAVGSNLETKTKPVYNKEGKMVYSKFNFADSKEKKKKSEYSGKNYKKLLYKAEKEKEQMKALEETNPEKAMNVKEKKIWRKAIEKSEGMKVKDDPELLKKSIKKQKERKHRSQKKWKKRKELTEKQKEKRQQKRKRNIRARKQEKVKKKIKKAKKKGRILPGL